MLQARREGKCKAAGCGRIFLKARPLQRVCSPRCAQTVAETKRVKAEIAEAKRKLAGMRTQPQWVKLAQASVNAYIRLRDAGKPCICCGRFPQSNGSRGGDWDAGHYRSRGAAPELRFDERNIHAQLKQCNRRAFDTAAYRANLIVRIGLAAVEELEGPHPPKQWRIPDLIEIRDAFKAKTRALKKEQDHAAVR